MSDCTDKQIGRLLGSYQLGLLPEAEADAFEVHLMECPACLEQHLKESEVTELIQHNPRVRAVIESLSGDEDDESERPVAARAKERPQRSRRSILLRTFAIAASLAILLILRPWNLRFDSTDEVTASDLRLTVALFDNLADPADSDATAAIITNLLVGDLAESQHLQIVSSKHLQDNYGHRPVPGDTAVSSMSNAVRVAEIARARWILSGSIVQVEPKLTLTTKLTETATGRIVFSHRITAEEGEDLFSLVDEVAALTRRDLLEPLNVEEEHDHVVADVTTNSLSAYRHYVEGLELYSKHYLSEAERSWRKALEYDSTFAMVYYCLAYDFDSSLIEKAVQYSGQVTPKERLYIQSLQALMEGDNEGAAGFLTELVDAYPNEVIAWMELGALAVSAGDIEAGVQYLLKSIEVDPVYKDAYWYLALVYRYSGAFDLALQTADKYLALVPHEPGPYHTRGTILARMGRLDEAVVSFKTSVQRKPDFGEYRSMLELGKLYIYQREYPKAVECLQLIAVEGSPEKRSIARTYLALVPLYQGQVEQTIAVLKDGITVDRMELSSAGIADVRSFKHAVRGMAYSEIGDYSAARRDLLEAISLIRSAYPDNRTSWISTYVYILAAGGDRTGADSVTGELKRHLTETASDLDTYYLSMGMMETGSANYARAVEWLQRISDPGKIGFCGRFCLARSLLEIERYDEAAMEFEAFVRDVGDDHQLLVGIWSVKAHYFLARAYESANRLVDAARHYEIFSDTWTDADPALKPLVTDARERLLRIETAP